MKILSNLLFLLLAFTICFGTIIYMLFPYLIVNLGEYARANEANLKEECLIVDDYEINFYKTEDAKIKDTLVLIHGLADNKKSFLRIAKYLSKDYCLVIPDLIGHGQNLKYKNFNYSFTRQAEFLKKLLDSLHLKKYHIAGVTTGGIVGLYIAKFHPTNVKSLTIINTPFNQTPATSNFYKQFSTSLRVDEELGFISSVVAYKSPKFSSIIKKQLKRKISKDVTFVNNTIMTSIKNDSIKNFESWLSTIKTSVLVLHSTNDKFVEILDATKYNNFLPNSTFGTIKETGHYPQYEKPYLISGGIEGHIKRTNLFH